MIGVGAKKRWPTEGFIGREYWSRSGLCQLEIGGPSACSSLDILLASPGFVGEELDDVTLIVLDLVGSVP